MTFSWPWALLSLLLVPIVLGVAWWSRRRRRTRGGAGHLGRAGARRAAGPDPLAPAHPGRAAGARPGRARRRRGPAAGDGAGPVELDDDPAGPGRLRVDVLDRRRAEPDHRRRGGRDRVHQGPARRRPGSAWSPSPASPACWCRRPPTSDKLIAAIKNLSTARGTAIGSAILTAIDAIAAIDPSVAPTGVDRRRRRAAGRLRARRHRAAHRRREHPGRRPGDRGREAAARGVARLHDRFRHHHARPDGLHRRAGRRLLRRRPAVAAAAGGSAAVAVGGRDGRNPLVIDEPALQNVAADHRRPVLPRAERRPAQDALATCPATSRWCTRRRRPRRLVRPARRAAGRRRGRALPVVEPGQDAAAAGGLPIGDSDGDHSGRPRRRSGSELRSGGR